MAATMLLFALLAALIAVLAALMAWRSSQKNVKEHFTKEEEMHDSMVAEAEEKKEGFTDCKMLNIGGQEIMECGADRNIPGKLFFHDSTKSKIPNMEDNNSDPYYFEKVITAPNDSHMRLTINDDADESFQIWGNSCAAGDCAGSGLKQHHFRADGGTAHAGAVVVGDANTSVQQPPNGGLSDSIQDRSWNFNFGLHALNKVINQWTHFPWKDGKNYIAGDTNIDGKVVLRKGYLQVQGNTGDILVFGGDEKDRGIWAGGNRPLSLYNEGNMGLTIKTDGHVDMTSVNVAKELCIGNTCVDENGLRKMMADIVELRNRLNKNDAGDSVTRRSLDLNYLGDAELKRQLDENTTNDNTREVRMQGQVNDTRTSLSDARVALENKMTDYNTSFNSKLTDVNTSFNSQLTNVNTSFNTQLTNVDTKFSKKLIETQEALTKQMDADRAAVTQQINDAQTLMNNLRTGDKAELLERIGQAEERMKKLTGADKAELLLQINATKDSLTTQMDNDKKALSDQLEKVQAHLSKKISDQSQKLTNAEATLNKRMDSERDALVGQIAQARADLNARVDDVNYKLQLEKDAAKLLKASLAAMEERNETTRRAQAAQLAAAQKAEAARVTLAAQQEQARRAAQKVIDDELAIHPPNSIIIFSGRNYTGVSKVLPIGAYRLWEVGPFDNNTYSMRISKNLYVQIWADDYGGGYTTGFTNDVPDMGGLGAIVSTLSVKSTR
jgi:hypothetical protein